MIICPKLDSSAAHLSGLSASTSTLGTAETAETELTPPSSLENNVTAQSDDKSPKKKAKLAADKRKRRKERERLAKQAVVNAADQVNGKAEDETSDQEDDGRAAALKQFRGRSDSTSTSSSAADVTISAPQASTSKLANHVSVPVWADDLSDSVPTLEADFEELNRVSFNNGSALQTVVESRSSRQWPVNDRPTLQRSRGGSRASLTSPDLSRRPSHVSSAHDDRFSDFNRAQSPASSHGEWQEVQSKFTKRPSGAYYRIATWQCICKAPYRQGTSMDS